MPNNIQKQILVDSRRNAVVRFIGICEAGDTLVGNTVEPGDFSDNEQGWTLTGFRLDSAQWSIDPALLVTFQWTGAVPQYVISLSRTGNFKARDFGGLVPPGANVDGNINLALQRSSAGSTIYFTTVLHLIKLYSR